MAIRLKDRIEANVRQSDKVNNSLSIKLNGAVAAVYDGSAAKTVNVTASSLGIDLSKYLPLSGGTMTGGITREVVTSYDANTGGASSTIATLLTGNSTGNTTGKDIEIYYTGKAKLSASGTTGVVTSGSLVYKAYSFNSSGNSLVYHYEFTFPKAPANLAKSSYFNFVYKENAKAVGSTSQPVYVNSSGQILACTDISTVGLTHIGTAQPTNSNYVLWVDTDEDTSNMMRADAIKYKTFSIATSAWSGSGPYTYTMTAAGITENSAILNLTLDAASQTYQKAQLDWETGANKITLSTATKPTGTISGYLIATEVTVI